MACDIADNGAYDYYYYFFLLLYIWYATPHPMAGHFGVSYHAHAAYSWIVNVNCLPRLFSNRFGGLISKMQLMPMASTRPMMNDTNMPDQIGAVVNPTQLIAESKRLPLTKGWACGKEKRRKFIKSFMCGSTFAFVYLNHSNWYATNEIKVWCEKWFVEFVNVQCTRHISEIRWNNQ